MGLNKTSTGKNIIKNNAKPNQEDYVIALVGNPNVGKSTIFNALTGLNQHTGNWTGKTVESAFGTYVHNEKKYMVVDLPGTYSLFPSSKEEEVTRDFICFEKHDLTVIVVDATMIERNLNLVDQIIETEDNVIVCVNLMDEAKKRNIKINIKELENILKVPVVGTSATNKKSLDKLIETIEKKCYNQNHEHIRINYDNKVEDVINKLTKTLNRYDNNIKNRFFAIKLIENNENFNNKIYEYLNLTNSDILNIKKSIESCLTYLKNNGIEDYQSNIINAIMKTNLEITNKICKQTDFKVPKIDKFLTSKLFGLPIMVIFLAIILWLTITGSNYPSTLLSNILFKFNDIISNFLISINTPIIIHDVIVNGVLKTLFWVISVMLPPMAIFFPLFTLLEDSGFLPRIAFNLDKFFNKAGCHGKQALSMCMGFGCNACGVVGCRIIDSPRERLIAILTNAFVPCNGRFPGLIALITMFLTVGSFSSLKSAFILT